MPSDTVQLEDEFASLVNRYYDTVTGQFLSVDPCLSVTLQPYAIEADDPLNQLDPLGLESELQFLQWLSRQSTSVKSYFEGMSEAIEEVKEQIINGEPLASKTFRNDDLDLPQSADENYYREFDVPDPLQPDRGSFRIIVGDDGEMYVSVDHCDSFIPINEEATVALELYDGESSANYNGPYGGGQLVLDNEEDGHD